MDAPNQLESLYQWYRTTFSPQPHIIHKPNGKGNGQALKIQMRMNPVFVETPDGGFFDREANKQGGLFVEIAPQGPKVGDFPTFLWKDREQVVRAKLGIPDITGLLTAIREWRELTHDVPPYLQGRADPKSNQVSLFHKYNSGSTIITYTFDEQQSILRISKGKDRARSIALTLGEELLLKRYLDMALEAHLRVGKR